MEKHPLVKEKNVNGIEMQKLRGEGIQPRPDTFCTWAVIFFATFLQICKSDKLLAESPASYTEI